MTLGWKETPRQASVRACLWNSELLGSSQKGPPSLKDEAPGVVGGRSFWTKGGQALDSGVWRERKEVGREGREERREGSLEEAGGAWPEDNFLLLHLALSGQNHAAESRRSGEEGPRMKGGERRDQRWWR